jgi:hypothetical protein
MIIFIGGMPRSGSTFSFNVARAALLRLGKTYAAPEPCVWHAKEMAGDAEHILMKAHIADEETVSRIESGEIKLIVTERDRIEDAVASSMDVFCYSLGHAISTYSNWLNFYGRVKQKALIIDYDYIDRYPGDAAGKIWKYIDPDWGNLAGVNIHDQFYGSKANVFRQTQAMQRTDPTVCDLGHTYFDTTTLYHRRHVSQLTSRTAAQRLGEEQAELLRAALSGVIQTYQSFRSSK